MAIATHYREIIVNDEDFYIDYWDRIRSNLNYIYSNYETANLNAEMVRNIGVAVDYVYEFHLAHIRAKQIIREYEQGKEFVLYLRSFSLSGRKKSKRCFDDEGNERSRIDTVPLGAGEDGVLLPILQEHLSPMSIITLSNREMFHTGILDSFQKIGALRAHVHNWESIVSKLIKVAKLIVIVGETMMPSMKKEVDLIIEHKKKNNTVFISVVKGWGWAFTSVKDLRHTTSKLNCIDYVDFFKHEKRGDDDWLTLNISDTGRKIIDQVLSQPKKSNINMDFSEIERAPCEIIDRDSETYDWSMPEIPELAGLIDYQVVIVQKSDIWKLKAWKDVRQEILNTHVWLDKYQIEPSSINDEHKEAIVRALLSNCLLFFVLSIELEQYPDAAKAILFLAARYQLLHTNQDIYDQLVLLCKKIDIANLSDEISSKMSIVDDLVNKREFLKVNSFLSLL